MSLRYKPKVDGLFFAVFIPTTVMLIGGMVLYVGNDMLDASIKARFEGLKKQLKTIQIS